MYSDHFSESEQQDDPFTGAEFEMTDHNGNKIKISKAENATADSMSWIDISELSNKSVLPEIVPTDESMAGGYAIPNNVTSYMDLPSFNVPAQNFSGNQSNIAFDLMASSVVDSLLFPEPNQPEMTQNEMNMIELDNFFDKLQAERQMEEKIEMEATKPTLKEITADADICRCEKCKCDPQEECHGGCSTDKPCKSTPTPEKPIKSSICCAFTAIKPPEPQDKEAKKKCCSKKQEVSEISDSFSEASTLETIEHTNSDNLPSLPNCKTAKEGVQQNGCCVVICLKSLETLKSVLAGKFSL